VHVDGARGVPDAAVGAGWRRSSASGPPPAAPPTSPTTCAWSGSRRPAGPSWICGAGGWPSTGPSRCAPTPWPASPPPSPPRASRPGPSPPCYGLAEATLLVSAAPLGTDPRIDPAGRIGCGPPAGGTVVVAVDPETGRLRPPGEEGELWIHGPAVASGYHGDPVATARTFAARLAPEHADPPAVPPNGGSGIRRRGPRLRQRAPQGPDHPGRTELLSAGRGGPRHRRPPRPAGRRRRRLRPGGPPGGARGGGGGAPPTEYGRPGRGPGRGGFRGAGGAWDSPWPRSS
jgi:acyl-CoA synthetase (AMP-forming)/AMP-acid ligase II